LIVIGADSHKGTHTVVALDPVGRRLGEKTVPTTSEGHLALVAWSGTVAAPTNAVTTPSRVPPSPPPSPPSRRLDRPSQRLSNYIDAVSPGGGSSG
jgi:hypothetical protein